MGLRMDLQYFAESGGQEKTEKATPKKRQDTRKKGQVAKSNDVNTALILLFVFILLFAYAAVPGQFLHDLFMEIYINYVGMAFTIENVMALFLDLLFEIAVVLVPIMLAALIAGVVSNMVQVGVLFAPEAIKPKLSKINPINGIKRIFSARAIVELFKAILKIILVGLVAFGILWLYADELLRLALVDVMDGFHLVSYLTGMIGIASALLLLILAVPDYVYQRYDHEKQIRMSKKEVKDEHKKMEGDPLIKSKRRDRAKEMAMQRMMQEVPKADVVITNPTHYAIALHYDGDVMAAPTIIAKGADYTALRMRQVAELNAVPTLENQALARSLYDGADIGDEVPEDLFRAVAEVLAYVYRLPSIAPKRYPEV
ncbi:flagellar biosynthesis protein FlhB [Natribacillus halophilus]|uniref:Flagellar biosynthetic protein FlhB n=1 Tax=Natribacillus halophilus TaxID=549003 RepID=A0A1G8PPC3_9BACI|nr:flagellar biosynthesis protein FlhB [Natribacillus halophilus]SDI94176.1 flagellar biosynthetic protein FlhB [Natribacillus halophilus]